LTGDSSFNAIQKQIKKQNLISKSASGLYRDLSRVKDFEFDSIVDRSEKLLRVYKQLISESTGRELKLGPNSLGEIDINKVLQADPIIGQYIKIKGKGTKRDIASGLGINSAAVRKIMNQLNREGVIKDIGLDEYFLTGSIPKAQKIVDPKIIQFMKDQAMSKLNIKTDDLTQILNTKQLSYYGDLRKKINQIVTPLSFKPLMSEFRKSPKTFYKGVDDIVTQTFNRMLNFGIRKGKTIDEVFESFQNQVEDPDFLNKVVPLMLRKVKKQDEISYYNTKYGLDIDDLHFSHKKRVVDDIDLSFKIFNVFNGTAKKNLQAEALQKQINNLQTILNAKGGKKLIYNEEVEKRLEREIKDLKFELDNGGYFDSAELEYESLNPENISQILTAQGQMFKDGGFASIEDVLDYRNG
jgi:DNA-binding Lrp family transcriptional regulator